MGTESVPETMEGFNILTWLFARENFIERFTVGSQFRLQGGKTDRSGAVTCKSHGESDGRCATRFPKSVQKLHWQEQQNSWQNESVKYKTAKNVCINEDYGEEKKQGSCLLSKYCAIKKSNDKKMST